MGAANVLVVFYSCCGETERLASTAAVGAVQARANIRLRRIPDLGADVPSECADVLERMRQGYIPPSPVDVRWADAVVFLSSDDTGHWPGLMDMFVGSGDGDALAGKVALVPDPTPSALRSAIASMGWTVLDPGTGRGSALHRALVCGRLAAMAATASRHAPPLWRDAESLLPEAHDVS